MSFRNILYCCFLLLFIFKQQYIAAQQNISFHKLEPAEGDITGNPTCFAQDKYGFIWIGTSYGLVKYDGYTATTFLKENNDPNSLGDNYITALYSDTLNNIIYSGSAEKLCKYDISKNSFYTYNSGKLRILDMTMDKEHTLWLGTRDGLYFLKEYSNNFVKYPTDNIYLQHAAIKQLHIWRQYLYTVTDNGLYTINLADNKPNSNKINGFSSDFILGVCSDSENNTWVLSDAKKCIIQQISSSGAISKQFTYFKLDTLAILDNNFSGLLCDKDDNVWITTLSDCLTRFNTKTGEFISYPANSLLPGSLSSRYNGKMFQDDNGVVWISNSQRGVSYFKPSQQLFNNLIYNKYLSNTLAESWGRCAAQQDEDHVWLGTVNGLSIYDFKTKKYKNISNGHQQKYLHSNSIRSLLKDSKKNIWIGTAGGLNRYNASTGKIEFFDEKQHMPKAFIWCIIETKNGKIMVGCTKGLFVYDDTSNSFKDFFARPEFERYRGNIGYLFEDARQQLWIATTVNGIYLYNPATDSLKEYSVEKTPGIVFNNRISNINEDKYGTIWIASYGGLTSLSGSGKTKFYQQSIGAEKGWVSSILFDSLNRVWLTTSSGLAVLNPATNFFKRFDLSDGLSTTKFIGQRDLALQNGNLLFASQDGFVYFNPINFKEEHTPFKFYVSACKSGDAVISTTALMEAGAAVHLSPTQNFFSFHLTASDIMTGSKIFFKYKLEGFDMDWVTTQQRDISYTNVPGGKYTFRYTASANPLNWDIPEKTIAVTIAIPFYRQSWFYTVAFIALFFIIYKFYRYRLKNIQTIEAEKTKSQQLLNEQLSSQLKMEQVINYFSSSLVAKNTVEDVLWDVAKNLIGQLGFEDCILYLWNDDKTRMIQKAGYGPKGFLNEYNKTPFDVVEGQGVVGYVMATKKSVVIPDTTIDDRYRPDEMSRLSEICVPVIHNNELIGAIDSEHHERDFFTPQHLQILTTIAAMMADKINAVKHETQLNTKETELAELDKKFSEAKITALRSQMNPHFLSNSLTSINSLILKAETEKASEYLTKFSRLMRLILDNSRNEWILLESELKALELYIEMEALRFEHIFEYSITVDDKVSTVAVLIPPLIIQPYVENAIWHGLLKKDKPGGVLKINIWKDGQDIKIAIEDNGSGRKKVYNENNEKESIHQSHGLNITEERLNIVNDINNMNAKIEITDLTDNIGNPAGTSVVLTIQFITYAGNNN